MTDFSESVSSSGSPTHPKEAKCSLDDCTFSHDIDYFLKTLSNIKAKGIKGDQFGSFITCFASKFLPELCEDSIEKVLADTAECSVTASWMKKRFIIETIVGILPPEKDYISCNFLLKLLRLANIVQVEPGYRAELERRISCQLDEATLKELMIPSFSHTCGTLLDIELVFRLVERFVNLSGDGLTNGSAMIKVAKLVDSYLAEAASESNLMSAEFIALAGALPATARFTHDNLYRAIDIYLKAHPGVSKEERKSLCKLFDYRKLSPEAHFHAAHNGRLPIRSAIQALFLEQTNKLTRPIDRTAELGFSKDRMQQPVVNPNARCHSNREITSQQLEIRKLREEVVWLQSQCHSMQRQIEKLMEKKKGWLFSCKYI